MIIPSAGEIRLDASSFPSWKATSALIGIAPGQPIQESHSDMPYVGHAAHIYSFRLNVASDSRPGDNGLPSRHSLRNCDQTQLSSLIFSMRESTRNVRNVLGNARTLSLINDISSIWKLRHLRSLSRVLYANMHVDWRSMNCVLSDLAYSGICRSWQKEFDVRSWRSRCN